MEDYGRWWKHLSVHKLEQDWKPPQGKTDENSKTNRIKQENTTAKKRSSWVAARYVIGKYQGSLRCGISPKVQLDLPHSECSNGTWQCKWQRRVLWYQLIFQWYFSDISDHLRSLSLYRLLAKQHVSHCITCRGCHGSNGCNSGSLSGEVVYLHSNCI